MRPAEIIERTVSASIRYEIISDRGHIQDTVFISYRIHKRSEIIPYSSSSSCKRKANTHEIYNMNRQIICEYNMKYFTGDKLSQTV